MKIGMSKRLLSILSVGIFVTGVAGFGAAYMNQVQEQKQLTEELTVVQSKTAGISSEKILAQKSVNQDQLTQYEAQIADTKAKLTTSLVVTDVFQKLLVTANNTNTGFTVIGSSPETDAVIGAVPYRALSLDFAVAGDAPDIYKFVDAVSTSFATGVLKTLNMSIPKATEGSKTVANMRLTIYSYRGE